MKMAEDWQKLDTDKVQKLLADINPRLAPVAFDAASTTVRFQRLPFYRDYVLYELTEHGAIPPVKKYTLANKSGDAMVIDWTNKPIYDTNEKAPVILNEDTVAAYVRFFFNYVRGRKGRFQLVEGIEDIRWQVEPPAQGRKVMQDMLSPVTITAQDGQGTYHLEGFMIFKDALFKTKIHVMKDGLISMTEEELKVEGLPVIQDAA